MARKSRISHAAGYRSKHVGLSAEVFRHITNAGKPVFQACVEFTRSRKRGHGGLRDTGMSCGEGRNPRLALDAALRAFGKRITRRTGTFARYRR